MTKKEILRILDANLNRSREGLRVCEEIERFVANDKKMTEKLKRARHAVSRSIGLLPASLAELVSARDSRGDVGKEPSALEARRKSAGAFGLFAANIERVKEALRALEETSKFLDPKLSAVYKRIRFNVYTLEKEALPKLAALRDNRPRRSRA